MSELLIYHTIPVLQWYLNDKWYVFGITAPQFTFKWDKNMNLKLDDLNINGLSYLNGL